MELVVFTPSLKFFLVEGDGQFIAVVQTVKKIGLKETIRITIAGIPFAVILHIYSCIYSDTMVIVLGLYGDDIIHNKRFNGYFRNLIQQHVTE